MSNFIKTKSVLNGEMIQEGTLTLKDNLRALDPDDFRVLKDSYFNATEGITAVVEFLKSKKEFAKEAKIFKDLAKIINKSELGKHL